MKYSRTISTLVIVAIFSGFGGMVIYLAGGPQWAAICVGAVIGWIIGTYRDG